MYINFHDCNEYRIIWPIISVFIMTKFDFIIMDHTDSRFKTEKTSTCS